MTIKKSDTSSIQTRMQAFNILLIVIAISPALSYLDLHVLPPFFFLRVLE